MIFSKEVLLKFIKEELSDDGFIVGGVLFVFSVVFGMACILITNSLALVFAVGFFAMVFLIFIGWLTVMGFAFLKYVLNGGGKGKRVADDW